MRNPSIQLTFVKAFARLQMLSLFVCALLFSLASAAQAETRTLNLYNTHTHERVKITFKKDGRYLQDGLREANRFLRDWRRNEITTIDPKLLDLVWEVYQEVNAKQPIYVVSSYRSPATNNMLRKRSSGVAKNSQHTLGHAMDFYIPGVSLSKLRVTGLRKQVGGVGYYPTSGSPFVHMDTGSVRHWPRMTSSQLAKVFPDGKTLHIPSNGKPLKGYKVALAEEKAGTLEKLNGGSRGGFRQFVSATPGTTKKDPGTPIKPAPTKPSSGGGSNFFASIFNNSENAERSRVASVQSGSSPLPPGQVGSVINRSSPAAAATPAPSAPPIPILKDEVAEKPAEEIPATTPPAAGPDEQPDVQQPFAVASAVPFAKPRSAVQEPPAPAGTLNAQRQALERGETPPSAEDIPPAPSNDRFEVAGIMPADKPSVDLVKAAEEAARTAEERETSARLAAASPRARPTLNNGAAAIAAATGLSPNARTDAPENTLAYASSTEELTEAQLAATPRQASNSHSATASRTVAELSSMRTAAMQAELRAPAQPSISGTIPRDQIIDPMAGFANLPNKSDPALLSSKLTKRNAQVAALHHPHQRQLDRLLQPGNRFLAQGFSAFPYGAMRSERFDGPAVIVLPVRYAR